MAASQTDVKNVPILVPMPAHSIESRRWWSGIRTWLGAWGAALPLVSVVGLCLVAPIVMLVARSFVSGDAIGLGAWTRVLSQPLSQRGIVTSLELGFTCAVISTLVGTPLAWLISRMLAGRRAAWLGLLNVAANFGGIGLAFAYIASLGTFGMVTLLLQGLGISFDPPARDSFAALVITYEHANIPLFVLLIVPAMGMLRDEWYEAAQASAATRFQFWMRIGLPVLLPFIGAGFVLSFMWSIGIFSVAYALAGQSAALPVQLITLQIGQALADDAIHGPERAAVLAVLLIALALTALFVYRSLLRRGRRWLGGHLDDPTGIGNRPLSHAGTGRGRAADAGRILLFGGFLVYVAVPILAVALYSIAARWTASALPEAFTLRYWIETFADPKVFRAFSTSLTLGAWTTVLVLGLSVPAVYWARVKNARITPILELSAAIPFALPFVVIGFAVLEFSGAVMPALQGSYLLLVLVYVAVSFPFVYWALDGAMAAADVKRLSEASETCGASPLQTIRKVVLPAIKPGLVTAAMLSFALAIGEFALVKVLAGSLTTISIWSAGRMTATGGGISGLAVVTTVVFTMLFALSAGVAYLNRGRLAQSLPGTRETRQVT
jgi:putative spermidine/putrescine transport system permease protein